MLFFSILQLESIKKIELSYLTYMLILLFSLQKQLPEIKASLDMLKILKIKKVIFGALTIIGYKITCYSLSVQTFIINMI